MATLMAYVIGLLFTASIYMMLRRSIVKLVIGLIILSNAANLLIFVVAGLTRGAPPLIAEGAQQITGTVADPLPQALILTAMPALAVARGEPPRWEAWRCPAGGRS